MPHRADRRAVSGQAREHAPPFLQYTTFACVFNLNSPGTLFLQHTSQDARTGRAERWKGVPTREDLDTLQARTPHTTRPHRASLIFRAGKERFTLFTHTV